MKTIVYKLPQILDPKGCNDYNVFVENAGIRAFTKYNQADNSLLFSPNNKNMLGTNNASIII